MPLAEDNFGVTTVSVSKVPSSPAVFSSETSNNLARHASSKTETPVGFSDYDGRFVSQFLRNSS